MTGKLKTRFGLLQWTSQTNGIITFHDLQSCKIGGVPFRFLARLENGVCIIVRMTCKLATIGLENDLCQTIPFIWENYLTTHPSTKLCIDRQLKQKVLVSNVSDLWKILSAMEAQLAAFRMTLESLDPK